MFENYIILLLVFPTYIYLGMGHEQHQCFSQSDEISIIYPEYSKIQIWNGRTTFIYIFRPFPIPILSAFLSYYIKYMFETLILFVFFKYESHVIIIFWIKVVEIRQSSKWNNVMTICCAPLQELFWGPDNKLKRIPELIPED